MSDIYSEREWPLGRLMAAIFVLGLAVLFFLPELSDFASTIVNRRNHTILKIKSGDHELELRGH